MTKTAKISIVRHAWNENYSINCDIDDLRKLGFENVSFGDDLAPSWQLGNAQVFFNDLTDPDIKQANILHKFTVVVLNDDNEYEREFGVTNDFETMLGLVKKINSLITKGLL